MLQGRVDYRLLRLLVSLLRLETIRVHILTMLRGIFKRFRLVVGLLLRLLVVVRLLLLVWGQEALWLLL